MKQTEINVKRVMTEALEQFTPSVAFESAEQLFLKSNKKTIRLNRAFNVSVMVLAMIISSLLVGFSYYKFIWHNGNIVIRNGSQDLSDFKTPLENFDEILQSYKTKDLAETKKIAIFPIRVPEKLEGFKKVKEAGVIFRANTDTNGGYKLVDLPLRYLEFYENDEGKKVVVEQMFSEEMTKLLKSNSEKMKLTSSYPKGTKSLNSFGDDLALILDLQLGRKELILYHIEKDKKVTQFKIYGTVDGSVLEEIAHSYINIK